MSSSIIKTFICSAIAASMLSTLIASTAPHLSPEWFALRKSKLTASTFATPLACGRVASAVLTHGETRRLVRTPNPRHQTDQRWTWGGVLHEPTAVNHYKGITGRDVSFMGLTAHADDALNWLGASPDGLSGPLPGPYKNGKPEMGRPWSKMLFYYMPLVQGLMEILDREWVDF